MFYGLISSLIVGTTYGLIISLLAVGLSLIYGVMQNVNTAHGAYYMLGGVLAFVVSYYLRLPPALALILVAGLVFIIGIGALKLTIPANSRVTVDPDRQNFVMITFLAFATIAEYSVLLIFGPNTVAAPSIVNGSTQIIANVFVTNQTLLASVITLLGYLLLYMFLRLTKMGKGIRAYTQNKETAEALGVDGQRLAFMVYGIGVIMAAISGALLASIFSIDSSAGWNELVIAFVIVTLGGIGSIFGSLIGGLIYGIIYSIMLYYYPSYAFIAVLLIIFALLLIKPTGILGEIIERA
ncbi:MAG: branched-chain amino acid ABC transporter permease [Conexivisphaerales archaeon]